MYIQSRRYEEEWNISNHVMTPLDGQQNFIEFLHVPASKIIPIFTPSALGVRTLHEKFGADPPTRFSVHSEQIDRQIDKRNILYIEINI